jgi:hypothetical protein
MDDGHVVVDSIDPIELQDVTYDLARESGFPNVEDLLAIARHGKGDNIYLVRFHYLPPGGWDMRPPGQHAQGGATGVRGMKRSSAKAREADRES